MNNLEQELNSLIDTKRYRCSNQKENEGNGVFSFENLAKSNVRINQDVVNFEIDYINKKHKLNV
jgi:hypothetical protein